MRIQDQKDHFTDYQIRDLQSGRRYTFEMFEVSKWTGGRVPETTYTVTRNPESGRSTCTCPASFRGKCKHIEYVEVYIQKGRPATFPTLEVLRPL